MFNYGTFSFGNGAAQLNVGGDLVNEAGADLQFLPNAQMLVLGQIQNAGSVTFQISSVTLRAGKSLANSGTWTLTQGDYTNFGTTSNAVGGTFTLSSGNFANEAGGILNNQGTITLSSGIFTNVAGGTVNNQGTIAVGSGQFLTQGATNNQNGGTINVTVGNFQNQTGGTLNNQGTITLSNGQFINQAATNNLSGGAINLTAGNFQNQTGGVLTNQGTITLGNGQFINQAATNNLTGGTINVTAGNFQNQAGGTLANQGTITLSNGQFINQAATNNLTGGAINVTAGNFQNQAGGTLNNQGTITLSNGQFTNQAVTNNLTGGAINVTAGNFQNQAGGTLNNQGTITLSNGQFINQAATNNLTGGAINVTAGNFQNQAGGTLANDGSINLSSGDFQNQAGGTMSGSGLLSASGSATFSGGSMLQGNGTITANAIVLQGTAAPGTDGTVGQITFNGETHFQGMVLFDLVTPGNPGVGNDLIVMAGGTGTIESGAQFKFHSASLSENVGDKYEILQGNIALASRPVATDNDPNRRIVLRTDQDINSFSTQGTAYYALVAWNSSFEQVARSNGGNTNEVTFGRYLDQIIPQDDHTIGTANADLQWIRDTIDLMPNQANVVRALGEMSGELYAPLATVALQRQFLAYNQLAGRLRDGIFQACSFDQPDSGNQASPNGTDAQAKGWVARGWVTGYGFGGSIGGDSNADGCSYAGGGLQVAYGYQPTEQLGFGFFYDFGEFGMTNDFNDRADAQAHSFGGYLTWHRNVNYFMLVAGGGFADCHATRTIELDNPDNVVARAAQGRRRAARRPSTASTGSICNGKTSTCDRTSACSTWTSCKRPSKKRGPEHSICMSAIRPSAASGRCWAVNSIFAAPQRRVSSGRCAAYGCTSTSATPRGAPSWQVSRRLNHRLLACPPNDWQRLVHRRLRRARRVLCKTLSTLRQLRLSRQRPPADQCRFWRHRVYLVRGRGMRRLC